MAQVIASRAKVTHITTVPQSLDAFLRGQIAFIRDRGFEVAAISSPNPRLTEFGVKEGIPVYPVEMFRRITPVQDIKALRKLVSRLSDLHPSIVHAHTPKGGLLGMISATIARVPIRIYQVRGFPYMAAAGKKRLLLRTTERVSCRLAHRVFCVSHSIRDVAIADGICPADKIVVFAGGSGNGVDATHRFDPERFSTTEWIERRESLGIGPSDLVIGFVGRIVHDKGIEELAGAWSVLREDYPSLHLALVGPVEPQDPVSAATLQMFQNDPRVSTTGSVDDTSEYYPIFDLVVLPSYREGLPNVPLEAAAMELPVVATRIPGCIDAIEDGVTGTLVPVRDADALATAIRAYLDDPELRQRHGKAGRERVLRDFRQEVIWEAIYQEYCRLLREKGLPVPEPVSVTGL